MDAAETERIRRGKEFWCNRRPTAGSGGKLRQPLSDIPISVRITDQIQTRMSEPDATKFKTATEQAAPSQAHSERFGAKKVFVSETRIFTDSDRVGFQRGASPQAEAIATDFYRAAKGSVKAGGDSALQTGVLNRERDCDVGDPKRRQK